MEINYRFPWAVIYEKLLFTAWATERSLKDAEVADGNWTDSEFNDSSYSLSPRGCAGIIIDD